MKTLDQVEPRTPVSTAQTIAAPGSYYVTNNISGTLVIDADNVDLDLNGFTLSGGSPNGVTISGRTNVKVHNGSIRTPTLAGVGGAGMSNIQLQNLRMSDGENCVSFFNPAGPVVVKQINCRDTTHAGISIVDTDDLPLIVYVHDNIVSATSTNLISPRSSIHIANVGTNDGTYADVRNNLVFDSEAGCILVFNGANAGSSAGTVTGNSTSFCKTGLYVEGSFIVTQNLAQNNELADYNFVAAPNAAPVTGINDSPGPWHNIATTTPVPEG